MNLIILTENDIIGYDRYRLTDHRAQHVRRILRSRAGDLLQVGLVNGPCGTGCVESIDAEQVVLQCEFAAELPAVPAAIDLICALPRPQTLKKVLLTSATMAVRCLHLIRANRVEKSYFNSHLLQPEQYERFLLEGLSQGTFTRLPQVYVHKYFKPFFHNILPALEAQQTDLAQKLLPDCDSDVNLSKILPHAAGRILLAIGPEGGWVPFEIDLMVRCGFKRFKLGRWTLRVETALAAALAQIELLRAGSK